MPESRRELWRSLLVTIAMLCGLVLTLTITCESRRLGVVTSNNVQRALAMMGRVGTGQPELPAGFPDDWMPDTLKPATVRVRELYNSTSRDDARAGLVLIDSVLARSRLPALVACKGLFWRRLNDRTRALECFREATADSAGAEPVVLLIAHGYAGLTLAESASALGNRSQSRDSLLRFALGEYDAAEESQLADVHLAMQFGSLRWRVLETLGEPAKWEARARPEWTAWLFFLLGLAACVASVVWVLRDLQRLKRSASRGS